MVKMLETAVGANDGIVSKKYLKGNIYDLSETLSKCFLEMGVAKEYDPNAKPTGRGKAVNEREILNKSLKELHNKEASAQLTNKSESEQKE